MASSPWNTVTHCMETWGQCMSRTSQQQTIPRQCQSLREDARNSYLARRREGRARLDRTEDRAPRRAVAAQFWTVSTPSACGYVVDAGALELLGGSCVDARASPLPRANMSAFDVLLGTTLIATVAALGDAIHADMIIALDHRVRYVARVCAASDSGRVPRG
ncbi:hypothetical protein FGB62_4g057 [Gracilaria domingensis]|nr:hypothetical protein FGB62_4g057 [Gracilaria domingensis]